MRTERASADYLNTNVDEPGHRADVTGIHKVGDYPSHFVVDVKDDSGNVIGRFDPWIDPFWWAVE